MEPGEDEIPSGWFNDFGHNTGATPSDWWYVSYASPDGRCARFAYVKPGEVTTRLDFNVTQSEDLNWIAMYYQIEGDYYPQTDEDPQPYYSLMYYVRGTGTILPFLLCFVPCACFLAAECQSLRFNNATYDCLMNSSFTSFIFFRALPHSLASTEAFPENRPNKHLTFHLIYGIFRTTVLAPIGDLFHRIAYVFPGNLLICMPRLWNGLICPVCAADRAGMMS